MTRNHGDVTVYLHWNTCTQVMHTAQNYKQKGEANSIYFQVETVTWWVIADLRNQHIELLDRALQVLSSVWRQRLSCLSQVSAGRRGRGVEDRQTVNKNLKQGHGRKKFFYSNREWKLLIFFKTLHQFQMLWPSRSLSWPAQAADGVTLWSLHMRNEWRSSPCLCSGAVVAGTTM